MSELGNPSKEFMFLELAVLPVKYVMITKTLNFLRYILGESTTSMIRQVYDVLKQESFKGDFVNCVQTDLKEIKLNMDDLDIENLSKIKWTNIVKAKVNHAHF